MTRDERRKESSIPFPSFAISTTPRLSLPLQSRGYSRGTTDAVFLLTIIGEPCGARKWFEIEDHEAVIETGCRGLLKSLFPSRHVLLCRATNARNVGANKGRERVRRLWTSHSQRLSRSRRTVRTKMHASNRHYSHVHQSNMNGGETHAKFETATARSLTLQVSSHRELMAVEEDLGPVCD